MLLACVNRVMDALGKSGEHSRSRVALSFTLNNSYASLVPSKLPMCIHNLIYARLSRDQLLSLYHVTTTDMLTAMWWGHADSNTLTMKYCTDRMTCQCHHITVNMYVTCQNQQVSAVCHCQLVSISMSVQYVIVNMSVSTCQCSMSLSTFQYQHVSEVCQ